MAEGLVIPITTPGGEESAAVLDRIADKLDEVGTAAGGSAAKISTGATTSSAAVHRIAAAAESTKSAVERLEESGNRGLHALSEKASELAGSMGGAAGKIADVGLKSLAAFGGIGLQATAAVGAVLMLYNAYQQFEAQQRAVRDSATALTSVNAQLGGTYESVAAAARMDGTAEERVNAIRAAGLAVLQQQIGLMQSGFDRSQSDALTQSIERLIQAQTGLGGAASLATREMLQHALISGNAEEQQRLLGASFMHSTDAALEHANVQRLATIAEARAAEATLAHRVQLQHAAEAAVTAARANVARAQSTARANSEDETYTRATLELAAAQTDLERITRQVGSATSSNTRLQSDAATATRELAAANAEAARIAETNVLKQQANEAKSRAAQARSGGGGGSAPTAQDLRAQTEALRIARAANDNARHAITLEQQMTEATQRLAFTSREVALADAARTDHTRRLTAALAAQTEVLTAIRTAQTARDEAYREGQKAVTEMIAAESDVEAAAQTSLRTGAQQLRQMEQRILLSRRAREDAMTASDEASRQPADGSITSESARAVFIDAEAQATLELARATQDLAQARREENDATIDTEERRNRVTTALAAQTAALQRQRAAQAASNAEVQRIRTERVDYLANSAKGLADGLIAAGLAAGFAGESLGDALQKQLAASMQALAIEAAQKSVFALATGFFQLAVPNPPAAAAAFKSAALYAAVAVTAGAVGSAIGTVEAPKTPASASGGATERASNVTPRGAGSSEGGTVINVNFGGSTIVGAGGARGAAREIANVLNDGARLGGVRLSPGLMGAR